MITPTKIHLTNSYVLHVVEDDCIINEETGSCLAVSIHEGREYGALIPGTAIAYYELPAGELRQVIRQAQAQGAGGVVKS